MKISVDRLTKAFGPLKALDDVSFALAPGRIVALVGPNGAGKTTLLRSLSAILVPDRGTILYDGESFNRGRMDLRKRLLFLPDTPPAYGEMSTLRHIGMVLQLYGAEPAGIEETVTRLLRELDMLTYAEVPLSVLSRGQLYKAVLTALVALNPELWLLDEPFASGMDPNGIMAFKAYAREAARAGKTVIYSTQILEAAEGFCDTVCLIHKGRLAAFGTMDELRQRVGRQDDVLAELFRQLRETDR